MIPLYRDFAVEPTESSADTRLTHYLFRYPAKFHPPIARALIEEFSEPKATVLDPFCGSGTLLVEAATMDRYGIGIDVDPVAVEVAMVKSFRYDISQLEAVGYAVLRELVPLERNIAAYEALQFEDCSMNEFDQIIQREQLWIPRITNLHHWFRMYVSIDLARILKVINHLIEDEAIRSFFRIVFASIIRNVSNADPVPVSGLEVTSHMKKRDAQGRVINPFAHFKKAFQKSLTAASAFSARSIMKQDVIEGNALKMSDLVKSPVETIITSPPYHNAVDYYRRHQLEMFWLGHVETHEERLALLPRYIGRAKVPAKHPFLQLPWIPGPLTDAVASTMAETSTQRATDFQAYCAAMTEWFKQADKLLAPSGNLILVVGDSNWSGGKLPSDTLMEEAANGVFAVKDVFRYAVKNRYMSYSRRNGADISHEYVLHMTR